MPKIKVKDITNTEIKEIELEKSVFDYPKKEHLVYEAVKGYNASQRQGTSCTKTRKEVKGSGRKLWRQKGTGRARAGSAKSPIFRSGGTVFGPKPRDYTMNMPKKARKNALKSVLSDKLRNDRIVVIDKILLESNKTKNAQMLLKNFNLHKVLIIDNKDNTNLMLSSRNIPHVKAIDYKELNIYDSLKYDYLMFSIDAVKNVTEVLK